MSLGMFIVMNSTLLGVAPRFRALASAELICLIETLAGAISIAVVLRSYRNTSKKSTDDKERLQSPRTANAPEENISR